MADTRFFDVPPALTLQDVAVAANIALANDADGAKVMVDVAPLQEAKSEHLSFFDNPKYLNAFTKSKAGACFVRPRYADQAPKGMTVLASDEPYHAYAKAAKLFYPTPKVTPSIAKNATIAPTAQVADSATIHAGAVIADHAVIGEYVTIGANSVIHQGVAIGDHSEIGALNSISHAVIGRYVRIHRGVHIGQDGFGYALSAKGHEKVPQLGRVIIEDGVEIGSGTTIDRGTGPDTLIGAGAKIDNLVQIGHNVQIGKGAIIIAQCGISGSTKIGAGTILAGQVGLAGHINIGAGVKIAAQSGVMDDIADGASYGGSPAMPVREWHKQTLQLRKLIGFKRDKNE